MFRKSIVFGVATAAAVVVAGCSMSETPTSPVAPAGQASNSLLGSLTGTLTSTVFNLTNSLLLRCEALPAQSVTQVVGRAGGRINVGPHSLVIPSGALTKDTRITARILGDDAVSVQFAPEGLRFRKKATLALSYSHCSKLLPLPINIVYTTDDLKILELLRSNDDPARKRVSAPLDHFSRYAAAWRNNIDSEEDDSEHEVEEIR